MTRWLTLLVLLAGCDLLEVPDGRVQAVDLEPLPKPEGPDSPDVEGVSVTLLDAGAEPRRALRYRCVADEPQTARRSQAKAWSERGFDGVSIDAENELRLHVQFTPSRLRQHRCEGDIHIEKVSGTVTRRPDDGRARMDEVLEALEGGRAQVVYTTRGLPEGIAPRLARIPDRVAADTVRWQWQAIGQLPVPLPLEPVGVGAWWQVVDSIEDDEVVTRRTTTYALLSLEEDVGAVSFEVEAFAEDQVYDVPRLPKGTEVRLQQRKVMGKGTATFDLARLLPQRAQGEGSSSLEALATVPNVGKKPFRTEGAWRSLLSPVGDTDERESE